MMRRAASTLFRQARTAHATTSTARATAPLCAVQAKGFAPIARGFHSSNVAAGGINAQELSSLLEQRNPSCDIRAYQGGQWACHHMWSLLDAEQDIPWPDQKLVFHHKYRFWVQPFEPSYHTPVTLGEMAGNRYPNAALLLGSPWEYDVPKCAEGVAGCAFEGGMWVHTISGSTLGQDHLMRYVSLNNHCHAPTCLSMAVYACPKGTGLADCTDETPGATLLCMQPPVYGGTGHPALHGTRFDETGYIAIPDCFWGGAELGLEPPLALVHEPLRRVQQHECGGVVVQEVDAFGTRM